MNEPNEPGFQFPRHETLWSLVAPRLFDSDLAHDRDHVLRVYRWALRLASNGFADADLTGAAALVHDLVNIPKEHPNRPLAGEQSADAATDLLRQSGYAPDEIEQIADAVRTTSWSCGLPPSGPLAVVLQDADRLDAIGAIGIARTFACAQGMVGRGRAMSLYASADLLGRQGRPADDVLFALDHFRTKLLRLAQGMHLPLAMQEAQRRQQTMLAFLEAFEREVVTAQ